MAAFTLAHILLLNFFLPALSSSRMPERASRYDGAQVLEIKNGPFVKDLIRDYDLDVWSSNRDYAEVMVGRSSKRNITSFLSRRSIPFTVKIRNLGEAIMRENPTSYRCFAQMIDTLAQFNSYQRLSAIYDYLDYLAENYPEMVRVEIMGYTFENRPLKYIKIFSGKPNAPAVFIDGGIHAREWISVSSVTYIIHQLVDHYHQLPPDFFEIDFYILPVLNPDGYEYSHTVDRMWRKNRSPNRKCYGVDINRNFNFYFGMEGVSENPCSDIYCGDGPNSELETRALSNFLLDLKGHLKAYITFHSYGQLILVPYGYDTYAYPKDFEEMMIVGVEASMAMRQIGRNYYKVGNTADLLYPASGASDDWAKAIAKADYAYTIELRDRGNFGFVLPASFIITTGREAFEAVKVIAMAAYNKNISSKASLNNKQAYNF